MFMHNIHIQCSALLCSRTWWHISVLKHSRENTRASYFISNNFNSTVTLLLFWCCYRFFFIQPDVTCRFTFFACASSFTFMAWCTVAMQTAGGTNEQPMVLMVVVYLFRSVSLSHLILLWAEMPSIRSHIGLPQPFACLLPVSHWRRSQQDEHT